MTLHMLSTMDNPYDPFTQWDQWLQFDESSGYHTLAYLARIVVTSHELSAADEDEAIELAIDEIIEHNVNGMYKKVPAPEGYGTTEETTETGD